MSFTQRFRIDAFDIHLSHSEVYSQTLCSRRSISAYECTRIRIGWSLWSIQSTVLVNCKCPFLVNRLRLRHRHCVSHQARPIRFDWLHFIWLHVVRAARLGAARLSAAQASLVLFVRNGSFEGITAFMELLICIELIESASFQSLQRQSHCLRTDQICFSPPDNNALVLPDYSANCCGSAADQIYASLPMYFVALRCYAIVCSAVCVH